MLLGLSKHYNDTTDSDYIARKRRSCAVLNSTQMRQADLLGSVAGDGRSDGSYALMVSAGQAVANIVHAHFGERDILVLAGSGNNGGDGLVAAMYLESLGHNVTVYSTISAWRYKGDARLALRDWGGKLKRIKDFPASGSELDSDRLVVIDALFGSGFHGTLDHGIASLLDRIKQADLPVIAIDIPSGVNADTGEADPHSLPAHQTVAFFKKKIAHMVLPSLELCGTISIHDIGIDDSVLQETGYYGYENTPLLWRDHFPQTARGAHKYSRGHALFLGGDTMTGAIRMASEAAMRMGAGVATVASPAHAADIYKHGAAHIMVHALDEGGYDSFAAFAADQKYTAILLGPGAGLGHVAALKKAVLDTLALNKPTVLDADALSCFADNPAPLIEALHEKCVITPHEGEFNRIFRDITGTKLERVKEASRICRAVILLKGADTIIVHKDHKPIFHTHATQWLATAGAGDVLAGMICGLLAQGMTAIEASCAAAWCHGEAAIKRGPGLVAPDIIEEIPVILRNFT